MSEWKTGAQQDDWQRLKLLSQLQKNTEQKNNKTITEPKDTVVEVTAKPR
jgi:hypothetical protein